MEELTVCPLSLGTLRETLRLPLVLGALPKPSQSRSQGSLYPRAAFVQTHPSCILPSQK